jgi:hypothetical protein
LKANDYIEVVYSDGAHENGIAKAWELYWNTDNRNHIAKYRKVN